MITQLLLTPRWPPRLALLWELRLIKERRVLYGLIERITERPTERLTERFIHSADCADRA
jgi:hypothetical protein